MNFRFLFIVLAIASKGLCQNRVTDSLKSELSHHPREDSTRVNILNDLAYELHYIQPTAAANYSIEAGGLAEKIGYAKGRASSYRFLGLSFWAQSNLSTALSNLFKGLAIADSIGNLQIQADITGNIGLVYSGMGNLSKALTCYRSSEAKQKELHNVLREAVMLNNIGDCYYNMKQYDSALITYRKAIEMGKAKNFGLATNIRNIGNVYEALGDLAQALRCYNEAKQLSDSQADYRGMTQARKSIASVFFKKRKFDLAEKQVLECLSIASSANLKAIMRDSYELLSKIKGEQGKVDQSFAYYKLFVLYRDSIQNLSEASKIASVQLEYETNRKQLEINALKKNSQMKADELRLKNTLLISAGIGISLISVLLFLSIRNYRHKKLQHQEVLVLNEKIKIHEKELIQQRDALADRNARIESLHKQLTEINEVLENTVAKRTAALKEQNKQLEDYSFVTSHELRAPVARILGLINLMEKDLTLEEKKSMFDHLKKTSYELDQIIRSISNSLQRGMTAYDSQDDARIDTERQPQV